MGVSEDPARSGTGSFSLSTNAVPVPDRAVAPPGPSSPETIPDLPVLTDPTRRRVPWGVVSSGSVVLLVACVWALGPLLPGRHDSSQPIPSLSIDGLSPDGVRLKNRPSPTATPTGDRETSTARTREQPATPSATSSLPAPAGSSPVARVGGVLPGTVPARTAPAPGEASGPQGLPSTVRSTSTAPPAPPSVPVVPSSAPTCSSSVRTRVPGAEVYLLTLSVTNTGSRPLKGWTATLTLPAGHSVAGARKGTVDTSGLPSVQVGNASRNGDLDPGETTEAVLMITGDGGAASPASATCSAN